MTREIERKFLLKQIPDNLLDFPSDKIAQGYLAVEPDGTQVRLRKKGSIRSLAFKTGHGTEREEREVELTPEQFDRLWPGTKGRRLCKTRYEMPWKDFTIELDVYKGKNDGLMVAEVEFPDAETCRAFEPPDWFGVDVSADERYSNHNLATE